MNRDLSRRERYLLRILPGVLAIAFYLFFFDWPRQKEVNQIDRSITSLHQANVELDQSIARAKKVPIPDVGKASEEFTSLTSQIKAEKRFAENAAHPSLLVPSRWTSAQGIDSLRAVASICETNGLILISRQSEKDSKKVLSKELDGFAAAIKNDGNHPIPEVWRIEVVGTYGQMQTTLDALGRCDAFVIPLAVSMDTLPDEAVRMKWSLWIWV